VKWGGGALAVDVVQAFSLSRKDWCAPQQRTIHTAKRDEFSHVTVDFLRQSGAVFTDISSVI
jgi:hypothetical protein